MSGVLNATATESYSGFLPRSTAMTLLRFRSKSYGPGLLWYKNGAWLMAEPKIQLCHTSPLKLEAEVIITGVWGQMGGYVSDACQWQRARRDSFAEQNLQQRTTQCFKNATLPAISCLKGVGQSQGRASHAVGNSTTPLERHLCSGTDSAAGPMLRGSSMGCLSFTQGPGRFVCRGDKANHTCWFLRGHKR